MPTALIYAIIANVALLSSAAATPIWVAYEGNAFPEDVGWERNFGAYDYPPQSFAHRSIEDGVFVLDSLHDNQIYDYYVWNGVPDPAPGELLIAEWRLKLDPASQLLDTGFQIATRTLGWTSFDHVPDGLYIHYVHSLIDPAFDLVFVPYAPDEFHDFRVLIEPSGAYELTIDGQTAHSGTLRIDPIPIIVDRIAFGDGTQGAASRQAWDYVRFGIVPEPASVLPLTGLFAALAIGVRRRAA